MSIAISFALGCATGWLSWRLISRWGMRYVSNDAQARTQLLDGLGFNALVKLRAAVDAELAKRKGAS